ISYLAVLAGLFMVRLPPWIKAPHASPLDGLNEGLRYMAKTPEVSALMRMVTVYSICGIPYLTLMPVVARDLLHAGADGYGVLLPCVGVGGLSGALFLASFGSRFRRGHLLSISTYGFSVLLIGFSLSRSEWLSRVLLLGCGFMMILNGALANSLLQSLVPDSLRGRLMAAYSLIAVGVAQVVGSFVAGSVANAVGVDWAIGGAAAVMLVYAYYAFGRSPEIRRL